MKLVVRLCLILFCAGGLTLSGPGELSAQTSRSASLRGTITDPSGAVIPDALIQIIGPGGQQRTTTDKKGKYEFATLTPGKYLVRVIAKGFTVSERNDFEILNPVVLDVQLTIEAMSQVVNVEDEANRVSVEPDSNGGAIVL